MGTAHRGAVWGCVNSRNAKRGFSSVAQVSPLCGLRLHARRVLVAEQLSVQRAALALDDSCQWRSIIDLESADD